MKNGARGEADVVVVGGGLAGLAVAAYLARAGRPVTLFERSRELGGRGATQEQGGFSFNLGPHALYKDGAGLKLLCELGVEFSGRQPPLSGYLVRGSEIYGLSLWSFLTTSLLSVVGKIEAVKLLASIPRANPTTFHHISLRDWLEKKAQRRDVRDLLETLVRVSTYGNDPGRMSAGLAVAQLQLALKGVYYLDGGWQTLVDGLRRAAVQAGARIMTAARVAAIEHDAAAARVRLQDGTVHRASAVVIAGSPQLAASLVEENAALRDWADDAVPVRAACLDIGLRRLPNPRVRFALGIDRPLYFSVHSATAKLAPDGGAMIHLAKYVSSDDQTDPKAVEGELEQMLDLLQPGWRDVLAERRFLPNMIVASELARATNGGLPGRPGPQVPGIENLYVAGDWVGPEGWLSDGSLSSAKRAAELVLEKSAPQLTGNRWEPASARR